MGFVARELERVAAILQTAGPLAAEMRSQLYAVQQALLWAIDPEGFKAPYDMIVLTSDTREDLEGCRAGNGHFPFSDTLDCRAS